MTNPNGVSPKQSAFAAFVAEGDSYTEAYRKAYDASKMKEQVVWNAASRLAKNKKVMTYIAALKKKDATAVEAHDKLSKDWIVQRLQDEAQNDGNPAATRVRALELLGKTSGLFDESTHITFENRTPEDVEKELVEKLAVLFPGGDASEA
tara:strand:- start:321 stop:770 length:450 start_codon:yes stop_codon:yes gene_type:complete